MQLSKLCLATKKFLSAMVITTTVLSTTPIQTINFKKSETNVSAATKKEVQSPRIIEDNYSDSTQNVTWDCIYFGSYPQTEIVDKPESSGTHQKIWETKEDYEVDSTIYSKLKNSTEWDDNGDLSIDGKKYRRINMKNATYSSNEQGCYRWNDEDTYHYFRYDKIKWRVLEVNRNTAFLLADKVLDAQKYNNKIESITWSSSTIRSWLNGYDSMENSQKKDYTKVNFKNEAFSNEEAAAIEKKEVTDNTDQTESKNDTKDQIFLLSKEETSNNKAKNYGFLSNGSGYDNARKCKSSTYAKAMGTLSNFMLHDHGNCLWWLRTPGINSYYASDIDYYGYSGGGVPIEAGSVGVRPALKMDLSNTDLWSYAGTISCNNTNNENKKYDLEQIQLVDANNKQVSESSDEYKRIIYLALAKFVYNKDIDKNIGKSIHDIMISNDTIYYDYKIQDKKFKSVKKYDEPLWKGSKLTYRQFYNSFVGDWKIIDYENDNEDVSTDKKNTGFVGTAFQNGNDIIISYTGSEGLDVTLDKYGNISLRPDWDTDMSFALYNELSEQFDKAEQFYKKIREKYPNANISFTGHSLGGALAGYEGILTGKRAWTFDSAVGYVTDLTYMYKAEEIKNFEGIDKTSVVNFTDQKSKYTLSDIIQHTCQDSYKLVENKTANNEVYEDNSIWGDKNTPASGYTHKILTSLEEVNNNKIKFTKTTTYVPQYVFSKKIKNNFFSSNLYEILSNLKKPEEIPSKILITAIKGWLIPKGRVMVGTSKNDTITAPINFNVSDILKVNTTIYGGNGTDDLTGSSGNDCIIAGKLGNKKLDGQTGEDIYLINPNEGKDITIHDCLGINTIKLDGYDNLKLSDITFMGKDTMYIAKTKQTINLKRIFVNLSKFNVLLNNKTYTWEELQKNTLNMNSQKTRYSNYKTTSNEINKIQVIEIDGKAKLHVYDKNGKLVNTFSNIEDCTKNIYKDYGYFYTYNNKNGARLIAYLIDGYTIKVEGKEKINIATALATNPKIDETDIKKDINLNEGDVDLVQKDNSIKIEQKKETDNKKNTQQSKKTIKKIAIKGISKQIAAGKSIKLITSILPKNAKNKLVTWKTSNKKVATVDKNGVVKVNKKAAGKTVTITAIAKDGSNKKATYKIKVMKGSVKSISIKGKKTVKAGKTLKLTAKVKASKGANKKLIWKSSNTKYATVSSSGKVIAKKTGKKKTVIITVMSTDGTNKKKTVKIKIK